MTKLRRGDPGYVDPRKGRVWSAEQLENVRKSAEARRVPLADRFWAKVDKDGPGGCWLWTGAKDKYGYGLVAVDRNRCRRVHRVLFELIGRELPKYERRNSSALVVDHSCKNTSCVNPDHLRLVPQAANCTTYSRPNPFTRNMAAKACPKGHPYIGENIVRILVRDPRNRERWKATRICLACYPAFHSHPRRFWLPEDFPDAQVAA